MKRLLLWFILVTIISCITISCAKKKEDALRILIWGTPEEVKTVDSQLESYKKLHPDFKYKILHRTATFFDEYLQLLFMKDDPPDLTYMSKEWFPFYAANNLLANLDEFITKDNSFDTADFYLELIESFRYNGKLYGIAKDFTTMVLYFNKDLFDKEGIRYPEKKMTWDQFLEIAKKLTKDFDNDKTIDQYGYIVETWLLEVAPWVWQNGAEITENRQWVLGDKKYRAKSIEALKFIYDLIYTYKVAPDPKTLSQFGGLNLFMSNKAAMCTYGRWACLEFKKIDNFKWGITHIPYKEKQAGPIFTVAWVIPEKSNNKELAWEVLKYFVGYDVQTKVAESGLAIPVRKSIAQSSSFLSSAGLPSSINQFIFIEALSYSRYLETVPQWKNLDHAINVDLLDPVFKENKPIDVCIDAIQKHADNILK
ncbi:MAG: sugar ABC transporter substrate-binding protein [Candidatus Hydrogenedentota bacterium]